MGKALPEAAVCEAIGGLAAANSEHLADLAKVDYATCLDCEKECRKHENEHAASAEECEGHAAGGRLGFARREESRSSTAAMKLQRGVERQNGRTEARPNLLTAY